MHRQLTTWGGQYTKGKAEFDIPAMDKLLTWFVVLFLCFVFSYLAPKIQCYFKISYRLGANIPPAQPSTIVHGDFRFVWSSSFDLELVADVLLDICPSLFSELTI